MFIPFVDGTLPEKMKNEALEAIKRAPLYDLEEVLHFQFLFNGFSKALRADQDVVLAAVSKCGFVLQFASEELQADKNFILAAVRQNGEALQYASEKLRADEVLLFEKRLSLLIANIVATLRQTQISSEDPRVSSIEGHIIQCFESINSPDKILLMSRLATPSSVLTKFPGLSSDDQKKYTKILREANICLIPKLLEAFKKVPTLLEKDRNDLLQALIFPSLEDNDRSKPGQEEAKLLEITEKCELQNNKLWKDFLTSRKIEIPSYKPTPESGEEILLGNSIYFSS